MSRGTEPQSLEDMIVSILDKCTERGFGPVSERGPPPVSLLEPLQKKGVWYQYLDDTPYRFRIETFEGCFTRVSVSSDEDDPEFLKQYSLLVDVGVSSGYVRGSAQYVEFEIESAFQAANIIRTMLPDDHGNPISSFFNFLGLDWIEDDTVFSAEKAAEFDYPEWDGR